MEERIVDKDDERLIRIKKTKEGTDAEDALTEESAEENEDEEVLVTLPEGDDYDEDLVGLTPSQLKKELERRKKAEEEARAECARLVEEAKKALALKEFEKADSFFSQATCYSFADDEVTEGLWEARTKDYADLSAFFVLENAEEFASCPDAAKAHVRQKAGEALTKERAETEAEIARISPAVLEKQEERRQAFSANRKYYAVVLLILVGVTAAFLIAAGVSASYIVKTLSSLPVVLTACFGGAALIAFVLDVVFLLKFSGANRLCRENEKLSSTQDGARLEELQTRLECLSLVLDDDKE